MSNWRVAFFSVCLGGLLFSTQFLCFSTALATDTLRSRNVNEKKVESSLKMGAKQVAPDDKAHSTNQILNPAAVGTKRAVAPDKPSKITSQLGNMKLTIGGDLSLSGGGNTRGDHASDDIYSLNDAGIIDKVVRGGAFVGDARIRLTGEAPLGSSDKSYGFLIELNGNTAKHVDNASSQASKYFVYYSDSWGKIQGGSYDSVNGSLLSDDFNVACGSGGVDGNWSDWSRFGPIGNTLAAPVRKVDLKSLYITDFYFPSSSANKRSNKVSYHSPVFELPTYNGSHSNISFGVSYQPSSLQRGNIQSQSITRNRNGGFSDVLDVVLKYNINTTRSGSMMLFTGAEYGVSNDEKVKDVSTGSYLKFSKEDLAAWLVGAKYTYGSYIVAASFIDHGRSGVVRDAWWNSNGNIIPIPNTSVGAGSAVVLGARMDQGNTSSSLSYMRSRSGFNSSRGSYFVTNGTVVDILDEYLPFNIVSGAVDYKVPMGFTIYGEGTYVRYGASKDSNKSVSEQSDFIMETGIKIKF